MRFIKLTIDEAVSLKERMMASSSHREIARCRCMMLSHKEYSINELADIFDVDRDTISNWFDRWESQGLEGLKDLPKSGCPPKLDQDKKKL